MPFDDASAIHALGCLILFEDILGQACLAYDGPKRSEWYFFLGCWHNNSERRTAELAILGVTAFLANQFESLSFEGFDNVL